MPKLEVNIPELPAKFNPKSRQVEYSPVGEQRSGKWPFFLATSTDIWNREANNQLDDPEFFTARLVDQAPEFRDCPVDWTHNASCTTPAGKHRCITVYPVGWTSEGWTLLGYVFACSEELFNSPVIMHNDEYVKATHARFVRLP